MNNLALIRFVLKCELVGNFRIISKKPEKFTMMKLSKVCKNHA